MFTVETHAASHIGRVRKGNEDNYLLLNISDAKAWTSTQEDGEFVIESQKFEINGNGVVMAVSDGMGGALAGEVASTMAVETVSEKMLDEDSDETLTPDEHDHYLISRLYNATVFANYLIHQQGRTDPQFQGMGATPFHAQARQRHSRSRRTPHALHFREWAAPPPAGERHGPSFTAATDSFSS